MDSAGLDIDVHQLFLHASTASIGFQSQPAREHRLCFWIQRHSTAALDVAFGVLGFDAHRHATGNLPAHPPHPQESVSFR